MTTVATTNPQEAKQVSNPQDAKMADTSENPQEVRQALSQLATRGTLDPIVTPELNGRLMKHPESPAIYLILNGYRRHIPDEATLNGLFVTNRHVYDEFLIGLIARGPDIEKGAMLAKGRDTDPWYLLPGGKIKMWIKNTTIAAQYQFRAVTPVDQELINSINDGPDVVGRAK